MYVYAIFYQKLLDLLVNDKSRKTTPPPLNFNHFIFSIMAHNGI